MKAFKSRYVLFALASLGVLCVSVLGIRAWSERSTVTSNRRMNPISTAVVADATLSGKQIQKAEAMISRAPSQPDGYNLLCAAFMQKARETGDFSFNAKAEAALSHSFAIDADSYDAIKLKATLLLTYHRFAEALEVARLAQRMRPRDHAIYGALTDALVELGRYDEADEAAEMMMSLKPDSSGYARISYLSSLHGETEAAIKVMRAAVQASTSQDREGLAWCLVHLGDELMKANKLKEAEREYDKALTVFADYHLAFAAKARARIASGDLHSAVEFYKKAQERVPLPDTAIALGDVYTKLGISDEAKKQYDLVEFIEQSSAAGASTYSRQLALFWANHDKNLDKALEIARSERASRADIYTCDVLAWCLFKTGNLAEAKTAINEALRLGTRDALIHYHAGIIYDKLGKRRDAEKHLRAALEINPTFDLLQAEVARQAIAGNFTREAR
jgi:tetratricopeptide (TPR) repeat protein